MDKTCVVDNCDRTDMKGRGMCKKHYERWWRNGDPLVSGMAAYADRRRAATAAVEEKKCNTCKKVKPVGDFYVVNAQRHYYQGHCKACHKNKMDANRMRERLENPPKPRVKVDHGNCSFPECKNKGRVRLKAGPEGWYCMGHLHQWNRNGELHTLRAMHKSIIDDRFRRCNACQKVKTHEDFHNRTNGNGKQNECKECLYKRTRFNLALKQERFETARQVFDSMPSIMQDKVRDRLEQAG